MPLSVLQPQTVVRYSYLHFITGLFYQTFLEKTLKFMLRMFCGIVLHNIFQGVSVQYNGRSLKWLFFGNRRY
jgi:hypothetical protein